VVVAVWSYLVNMVRRLFFPGAGVTSETGRGPGAPCGVEGIIREDLLFKNRFFGGWYGRLRKILARGMTFGLFLLVTGCGHSPSFHRFSLLFPHFHLLLTAG